MLTTIEHHPDDAMLLDLAAGRLTAGTRRVLHSHLELCPQCREQLRALDALGGLMLDEQEPAALGEDALARTFARIDAGSPAERQAPVKKHSAPPPLPPGARWPRALAGCRATPWRFIAPGMHWSRVSLPEDSAANVFLLRIGAGKYLPSHTHSGLELTQVLHGCFHDGRALFGPGDFDAADGEVHHQPVVQEGSACICLASVEGRLQFDGFIARLFGAMVGM
ncbi:ChrR family anti-sigma-E factor [Pelomonas sp. KK5]|uniref:ChrR family anti-sigma-E factor n=1 Tax=Pelomonas sp. KK5 TaxID=1855730 RepID=UPI00097BF4DA|nr:ChrR family anti-sigma-E factor [Pelomonas sp. KK5]